MNKKIAITILFVCALFCCYTKIRSTTQHKIVLQYASWGSESELKFLKPIINEYELQNSNVKIEFMHIPQNYFQKLHLLFASNTAPDIIFINNQYLPIYANANVLEDLSNYKNDLEISKYYKQSVDSLTWNNKLYAIPRDISNLVVFYNKDLFDKHKVKYPKDNWTLNNLLNISKKLTDKNTFGISFDEEPLFYMPYLMSFGVDYIPNIQDKKTLHALNFYSDLRNKYKVAPKKTNSASETMAQMFLQQKLAMQVSGRWLVPKYRQEANFDWDIVKFPRGLYNQIPLDSSGWAIAKSSKNKTEAIKFVKYISNKENSTKFTQSGLIVPARIDVINTKVFMDNQKPQNKQAFIQSINFSKPTAVSIDYKEKMDNLKIQAEYLLNKE